MFFQSQAFPTEKKSEKTKGVQKKAEFQNLASKKPNWQPCHSMRPTVT